MIRKPYTAPRIEDLTIKLCLGCAHRLNAARSAAPASTVPAWLLFADLCTTCLKQLPERMRAAIRAERIAKLP